MHEGARHLIPCDRPRYGTRARNTDAGRRRHVLQLAVKNGLGRRRLDVVGMDAGGMTGDRMRASALCIGTSAHYLRLAPKPRSLFCAASC